MGEGVVEIARFSGRELAKSLLPALAFCVVVVAFGIHTFGGYENQTFSTGRVRIHSVVMVAGGVFIMLSLASLLITVVAPSPPAENTLRPRARGGRS